MKIFLDSADPKEVRAAWDTGMIDGITTNPTLATKAGVTFKEAINEILQIVQGPVNLEVLSTEWEKMVEEGKKLAALHTNVVVKIPMTKDGIKACKQLSSEGIKTNVTLVFSPAQALLAAKAGATYVSPFIGRLADISHTGIELVAEIRSIYDNYGFETMILTASERVARDAIEAALVGSDVVTMKYSNFENLFKHPLTDVGLERFLKDWQESGQEALI